ncbi:MFS transporter [Fulvivirga sedimenti]|uniref:MFS transporter n=1 Tax=Fulvivirga sedimenti TaxID=2879465 RepID=A0A9X1HUW5_9BACT|nr:MFS transporter [Fulvivirga sedimenti]MCA6075208.1 MFS transporter [Fulvivirga sedimenti]MCA6076385.1 MFS transporter [Fulvivirga sedimenti]MCA6077513.1 MFS transporter [Fulvivirga sedimenti]
MEPFFNGMKLNDPKIINGWCMYDWANSVYSLVITSAIFPVYYQEVTASEFSDTVQFFGFGISNTVLYSYALSASFLITAIILPLLSGMADYSGRKKNFMKGFVLVGGLACMGLYFFRGDNIELGILLSMLASIGYSGSLVFYDAFLPEIATPDRFDKISARGYAFGYVGSVILLLFNIFMLMKPDLFGIPEEQGDLAARISFLMVGLWWIGFSIITFIRLPNNPYNRKAEGNILTEGYLEIQRVYNSLSDLPNLKKFLFSFFFYNMGVQTVMYLAASFGSKELKMASESLILIVLIIQLVAIAGAYFFAHLSQRKGNRYSLIIMINIWILICLAAYFVYTTPQFFALAFAVGLVMGGIQSLSRATYAKLIPESSIDHASYFSFYDVTYYISTVVGTFVYGLIEQLTGSMRSSTLALMIFFVIGLLLMLAVRIPHSRKSVL